MLESFSNCPTSKYLHIVLSPKGTNSVVVQLNYITDIVLELKDELAKIKTEVTESKK